MKLSNKAESNESQVFGQWTLRLCGRGIENFFKQNLEKVDSSCREITQNFKMPHPLLPHPFLSCRMSDKRSSPLAPHPLTPSGTLGLTCTYQFQALLSNSVGLRELLQD